MLVPSTDWQPMIQRMELKPLCSLILEKTINDPDKYQSGLTKIFFRAGMLAALESLRSEKLNALVTVVQKNMRRRMAVKKYQDLRRATIKIQTWWRGILARRLVESIRRDVAAIRLQTGIRCFIQRSNFLQRRRSIVLFQSRMYFMKSYITIVNLLSPQVFAEPKPDNCTEIEGYRMQLFSYNLSSVECASLTVSNFLLLTLSPQALSSHSQVERQASHLFTILHPPTARSEKVEGSQS